MGALRKGQQPCWAGSFLASHSAMGSGGGDTGSGGHHTGTWILEADASAYKSAHCLPSGEWLNLNI